MSGRAFQVHGARTGTRQRSHACASVCAIGVAFPPLRARFVLRWPLSRCDLASFENIEPRAGYPSDASASCIF